MSKNRSNFVCQQCGYSQIGWSGKCPECGAWGSLVETVTTIGSSRSSKSKGGSSLSSAPISLSSVVVAKNSRTATKISEFDRVLGGGLVSGQVVLLAGEPGIGKSTLLLQVAKNMGNCLYVAGEESAVQIKIRADRLGISNKSILIAEETQLESIMDIVHNQQAKETLSLIIIDSIQTITTANLSGMAGSVGQVRESASQLTQLAKRTGVPVIMVGHATKEGSVAGPATLAHVVDTVCWFEGDKDLLIRTLRATKNRFGTTEEIGVFKMEEQGLVNVSDLDAIFVSSGSEHVSGSIRTCLLNGTRPILAEIQTLLVKTHTPYPRRVAQGVDAKRLELLLAVLTRRCGLPLYEWDVYVNVVGGIRIEEPGADLAIALSIASSFYDKPLGAKTVVFGEVGLLGEIRPILGESKRIKYVRERRLTQIISSKDFNFVKDTIKKLLK